MNDDYVKKFFEGPFPSRTAAIRGTAKIHGEKSLVIGEWSGQFWGRPWAEATFHAQDWPASFECVSRFSVGVATMPQLRLSRSPSVGADKILPTMNMTFANWLKGERATPIAGISRYDFRRSNE